MSKNGRPPKKELAVSVEQGRELEQLAKQARTQRSVAFRAKIVLECSRGLSNSEVAKKFRCSNPTVGLWRNRFIDGGVDALFDEPRPGTPRKITDDKVDLVVRTTLEQKPRGATHWSTRSLAKNLGMSQSAVLRIWKAFGLQPHRAESFQLSNDPMFIEKVRDIVGLYMSPPTNALVLCVDEKSQIQALSRSQPIFPMMPGVPERASHDYKRHGTTSLFAALDVATGNVIGRCFERHRSIEFKKFLDHVDSIVPAHLDVHLVLDNYATHKTPLIKSWLSRRPRYHLHFTPTHSSWINQIERWFALLTQKKIKRGSHLNVKELKRDIQDFIEVNNEEPKPFVWTKSADQILQSISRFAGSHLAAQGKNF